MAQGLSDDTVLLLYALYKQATLGPCTTPKPWTWNMVEIAKWNSWNHLGNMNSMEAMRLFVRTLEDSDPNWLTKAQPRNEEVPDTASDTASVESASRELTKLLLEKDVPSSPKEEDVQCISNGQHTSDDLLTSKELDPEVKKSSENESEIEIEIKSEVESKPEMEGIDAITTYQEWVPVTVTGRKPLARYKHAAAVVEGKLYVIGGNHNGRFLNDVQVLDLKTLEWTKADTKVPQSPLSSEPEPLQPWFPQCAGHGVVRWGRKLISVAGHFKYGQENVTLYSFDTHTSTWTSMDVFGKAPPARGGQTITLIGSQIYMFGGEDLKRRLLNDLHVLDLETMTWDVVIPSGVPPSPRSDHIAAAYNDKYIFFFGGGSHSTCYGDLHVLDIVNMEWSPVQTQGSIPTPRAGHAGATIGDSWYVLGGGDNKGAISETHVLDMTTLMWSTVATVEGNSSVASEGLSVVVSGESLLTFGGYNGKFSSDVHVFKLGPPKKPLIVDVDLPVVDTVDHTSADSQEMEEIGAGSQDLAELRFLDQDLDKSPSETKMILEDEAPATRKMQAFTNDEVDQLRIKALAKQVEDLKVENATALSSLADVEQELLSVRSQLQGEQHRSFRLEVEVAELRQKLSSMEQIQKELDLLQRQKVVFEKAASEASQKESTGVWGWLAGAPPAPRLE